MVRRLTWGALFQSIDKAFGSLFHDLVLYILFQWITLNAEHFQEMKGS